MLLLLALLILALFLFRSSVVLGALGAVLGVIAGFTALFIAIAYWPLRHGS
jgi:hypothetical protein